MASSNPVFGHGLVDHLFYLQSPRNDQVAVTMDTIRAAFIALGHRVVESTPEGPDQTVAIRKLHEALMAAIGCIALNQPEESEQ